MKVHLGLLSIFDVGTLFSASNVSGSISYVPSFGITFTVIGSFVPSGVYVYLYFGLLSSDCS